MSTMIHPLEQRIGVLRSRVRRLVVLGLGVALMPRRAAETEIARGEIIAVGVREIMKSANHALVGGSTLMDVPTSRIRSWRPLTTDSWHVSVHLSIAFSICVLCGNGIGCSAAGRS